MEDLAIPSRRRLAVLAALAALVAVLGALAVLSPGPASAAPCLTCEDTPPPPPPTGPPPPPPVRLDVRVNGFFQYDAEDGITDEIYLDLDDQRVWGPHDVSLLDRHGWRELGIHRAVIGTSFLFEMYDEDWPDRDDALGRFRVDVGNLAVGHIAERELHATNYGSHYRIELTIRRTA